MISWNSARIIKNTGRNNRHDKKGRVFLSFPKNILKTWCNVLDKKSSTLIVETVTAHNTAADEPPIFYC